MLAVEAQAFNQFQQDVVNQFQDYLLESEVKRFDRILAQEEAAAEEAGRAEDILEDLQTVPAVCGPNRYSYLGQVGGRRAVLRVAEQATDPRFTSTQRHDMNMYGPRNHFQRVGLVTNPVYTKKPDQVRAELQKAVANVLTNRDISLPGAVNIPESQYEINMQSRARYSDGNTKDFDRATNAQLAKGTIAQKVQMLKQVVQSSQATKGYGVGTNEVIYNEDTALQTINEAPRGYLASSDAPKEYEISAEGMTRLVHRTESMAPATIVEPAAILTEKFTYDDAGTRLVVNREKFSKEGQGSLDVVSQLDTQTNTRAMPDIQYVTRPTAKYDRSGHHDAVVTNLQDPVQAHGYQFVSRGIQNTERDGNIMSNVPAFKDDLHNPTARATTTRYYRGVDNRGVLTAKNPNVFKGRVPLPRMVDNIERF